MDNRKSQRAALRKHTLEQLDLAIEHLERSSNPEAATPEEQRFERISKLVAARVALEHPRRSLAWPAGICALAAATLLLEFLRVPATELEARLLVSALSFRPHSAGSLTLPEQSSVLGVDGIASVDLRDADGNPEHLAIAQAPLLVRGLDARERVDAGGVTIQSFEVGSESSVKALFGGGRELRLHVSGTATLEANVFGRVQISSGQLNEVRNYPDAVQLRVRTERDVDLSVAAQESAVCLVCQPIDVDEIEFVEADIRNTANGRYPSSVDSGSVHLLETGVDYELHHGEYFRPKFDPRSMQKAEIRQLRVDPVHNTFEIALHGWVTNLKVGTVANSINFVPTWLERLRAHHGTEVVWSTLVALVAAWTTLLRWLGRSDSGAV